MNHKMCFNPNRISTCEICGKEGFVMLDNSTYGGAWLYYCKNCHETRIEPYDYMVYYFQSRDIKPVKTMLEKDVVFKNTLEFHNKTFEEFERDVNT